MDVIDPSVRKIQQRS